jgi:hypothetical protein
MDVDLAKEARAAVDEGVSLAGVDDRELAGSNLARGDPVSKRGRALEDDQDLDVRVAVKARALARRRVDEQHACADAAVPLTDEVVSNDVARKLIAS